jgi:hypothetical protein
MRFRFIAPVALAATAATIALAPVAAAAPTATTNNGGATVVQSPGNAQITAQPGGAAGKAAQLQYPFSGLTPLEMHHQFEHHHH